MRNLKINKTALVFISSSSGELDWVLPILFELNESGFTIQLCYLSNRAKSSVHNNNLLSFQIKKNNYLEITIDTGFRRTLIYLSNFLLKINRRINYRFLLLLKNFISLILRCLGGAYTFLLPSAVKENIYSNSVIFMEFPFIQKPFSSWIKLYFSNSLIFYFPHSPHFYGEDFSDKSDISSQSTNNYEHLLLGHRNDFYQLRKYYDFRDINLNFIGHPKYSSEWIKNIYLSNKQSVAINFLVISRGIGNYLSAEQHEYLVISTYNTIRKLIPNAIIHIKKHPREKNSAWDKFISTDDNVFETKKHIMESAALADCAISFWGSGAMDCFVMGLPVIEFFDPNVSSFQQVKLSDEGFTTIYRELGCVYSANNQEELDRLIRTLILDKTLNHDLKVNPILQELINDSNKWKDSFYQLLSKHDLL